jgi:acid stress-induced BolA-like protein IbaG/YrbA
MISAGLPGAEVRVSGDDGTHFDATVISKDFEGKSTIQRHRMVYATLGEAMGREIHALGLTTLTPDDSS